MEGNSFPLAGIRFQNCLKAKPFALESKAFNGDVSGYTIYFKRITLLPTLEPQ